MSKKSKKLRELSPDPDRDARIERYGQTSGRVLSTQALAVLAGNAVVAYLLAVHRIQPLHLVLFVGLEGILLSLVATAQFLSVPRSAAPTDVGRRPGNWIGAMVLGFFGLIVLNGALIGSIPHGGQELREFLSHPLGPFHLYQLLGPLSITLAAALADTLRDSRYFARHPRRYVSTPALSAQARLTTLLLGMAPGAILVVAILYGGRKYFRRREKRPAGNIAWMTFFVVLVAGLVILRSKTGLAGWAIGYIAAKVTAELFFVFLPWISAQERAQEAAAAPETQSGGLSPAA
ncbi:MAG TPA: hypothetical protein VN851_07745 [Thermoanaerobaculia bacterium]|nr:hypothetical protein [Thermoanaerobaculia bacterium]